MSLSRILTVLKKDVAWALGNIKILAVMSMPVFSSLFFFKVDSATTFVFSLVFVNAFIGIFSTSYLVIEEKNKGTLLALLTSPLTAAELLFGKFLFNLILCGGFSLMVIVLNQRWDLFVQPLTLLNILLFAGTTCFVGFIMGVFFKNEQEMSVLAPILMVFFCFGDAVRKVSDQTYLHVFFPDYHVAQSVKDVPIPLNELVIHSLFSLFMFAVAFIMAALYTRFYFSNNRENRWSKQLLLLIGVFAAVLVGSGLQAKMEKSAVVSVEGLEIHEFFTDHIKVQFKFDPQIFKHRRVLESREKSIESLSLIKNKETHLVLSVRSLEEDEKSKSLRKAKIKNDIHRTLISHNVDSDQYFHWIYEKQGSFIYLKEKLCGPQIFQYSLDMKLKDMRFLKESLQHFQTIFFNIEMQCLKDSL